MSALRAAARVGSALHPDSVPAWTRRLETDVSLGSEPRDVLDVAEQALRSVPQKVRRPSGGVAISVSRRSLYEGSVSKRVSDSYCGGSLVTPRCGAVRCSATFLRRWGPLVRGFCVALEGTLQKIVGVQLVVIS